VILLGQDAGPGTSAGAPARAAAAPGRQVPAAAGAHSAEGTPTEATPATDAAVAEAAPAGAAATTEPATTTEPTTQAATTQAAATEASPARTAAAAEANPAEANPAETNPAEANPAETAPAETAPAPADAGLFARYTSDYVSAHAGHQVMILQAGCTTAGGDLGADALREAGADIVVSLIDDDQPVTRAAVSMDQSLTGCVQGDLRTVPLPPRSHDIVLCALLLQRIKNAELVLDRLVAAIKPGGLLLVRFSDRDSGGGFLDRVMPSVARSVVWRKRRPGRPGPYPAVYERLSSVRGVQAYALMRELVIAERQAVGGLAGALAEPRGFLAAQKLIAWLSRGRLTAAHEELLYVLRKPEDRFARIL
jgi:SAM-dependent methyltransferase